MFATLGGELPAMNFAAEPEFRPGDSENYVSAIRKGEHHVRVVAPSVRSRKLRVMRVILGSCNDGQGG